MVHAHKKRKEKSHPDIYRIHVGDSFANSHLKTSFSFSTPAQEGHML